MSWITLKNDLIALSRRHQQVNGFGSGDPISIGADNTFYVGSAVGHDDIGISRTTYPLVFVDVTQTQFVGRSTQITADIYFLDKMTDAAGLEYDRVAINEIVTYVNSTNEERRWKDSEDATLEAMLLIAQDYFSYFTDSPDLNYFVSDNASLQRLVDTRDDILAGWKATFLFQFPFNQSVCQIPIV